MDQEAHGRMRLRSFAVAVIIVLSVIGGAVMVSQFIIQPSMKLTPPVALAGNAVGIKIEPQGLLIKGGFFRLQEVTYWPSADPSAAKQVQSIAGLSASLTIWKPGSYIVQAKYVNAGSAGSITQQLKILPSNFTIGPLRYGSAASYGPGGGSLLVSNPYGILAVPVSAGEINTTLSVVSIGMHLNPWLNITVSNRSFTATDGLSYLHTVYAVNSTLHLEGTGYVLAIASGLGLNLSASLSLNASSTILNLLSGNSTMEQRTNISYVVSVKYLGGAIDISSGSSSGSDLFAQVSATMAGNAMFSAIGVNGSFSMTEGQMIKYSRSVPAVLDMNQSGTHNGYTWKAGAYTPSLTLSTLAVGIDESQFNTTYTVTLGSDNALPVSYAASSTFTVNGTHASIHLLASNRTLAAGTSDVMDVISPAVQEAARGEYSAWQPLPFSQLNDSALIPLSLQDAYSYSMNHTTLSSYISSNSNAFISSAGYNFTLQRWTVNFSSPEGNSYTMIVTAGGGVLNASGSAYTGAPSDGPPSGDLLELASAFALAASSSYSDHFFAVNGTPSLSSVSFELALPYATPVTPFMPLQQQYSVYAYRLTSGSGAVLAIDCSNGQLMYFTTGAAAGLL